MSVTNSNHAPIFCLFQNAEVSVFEVNIRFIGGLLAAYYLSGQEVSALPLPPMSAPIYTSRQLLIPVFKRLCIKSYVFVRRFCSLYSSFHVNIIFCLPTLPTLPHAASIPALPRQSSSPSSAGR